VAVEKMLKFVTVGRDMPQKRDAHDRLPRLTRDLRRPSPAPEGSPGRRRAAPSAGVPYCQTHCPGHHNIPDWLRMTGPRAASARPTRSRRRQQLPEFTGRICPQDRLCEGNCVIEQSGHGTVTIGSVEAVHHRQRLGERAGCSPSARARSARSPWASSERAPRACLRDTLRRAGVQVTVYDRYDRAGGPAYLRHSGLQAREGRGACAASTICATGRRVRPELHVGEDLSFDCHPRPPRRGAGRDRRLQVPRHRQRRRPRHRARHRLPHRLQPQGLRRRRPDFDSGEAQCRGQARGGDRRRRHRHGLRAAPPCAGRDLREVPLSPRPGQHAGEPARGRQRRGGGRGVRVALRARRLRGRGLGPGRARDADAPGRARRLGPPRPRARRRDGAGGGGPRGQGAGLRARGPARALGHVGPRGHAMGHGARRVRLGPDLARRGSMPRATSCAAQALWSGRSATGATAPRRSCGI
jgi:hypothetical protein